MEKKKLGKINADLGIGPMSSEIIEATFRYSHYYRKELMLIASKNQIDHHGGYVNGWTTAQFCKYTSELKDIYNNSNVKICRDHCGPGFNGIYDIKDTYETIKYDVRNGFDLIHIDLCHLKGTKEELMEESRKAIEYALELNPDILIEIGTDENLGANYNLPNLSEIEKEIDYFRSFCAPEFYVMQTGSLIREINQTGTFNKEFVSRVSEMLEVKGIKLKEHNADYLNKESIALRKNIIGAMNIAPQMGVVQTMLVLNKCLNYGVNFEEFINNSYNSKKWKKWLAKNTSKNRMLCSIISGHYVFNSKGYKRIVKELADNEDINETLINNLMDVINHYEQ